MRLEALHNAEVELLRIPLDRGFDIGDSDSDVVVFEGDWHGPSCDSRVVASTIEAAVTANLDSLARALSLEEVERAHLYALAHSPPATWIDDPSAAPEEQVVRPEVLRMLRFLKAPAMVVGRGTAVLASNPLSRALIADFDAMAPNDRFYAIWLFTDPLARQVFEDRWERYARETVAVLRRDTSRWPRNNMLR